VSRVGDISCTHSYGGVKRIIENENAKLKLVINLSMKRVGNVGKITVVIVFQKTYIKINLPTDTHHNILLNIKLYF